MNKSVIFFSVLLNIMIIAQGCMSWEKDLSEEKPYSTLIGRRYKLQEKSIILKSNGVLYLVPKREYSAFKLPLSLSPKDVGEVFLGNEIIAMIGKEACFKVLKAKGTFSRSDCALIQVIVYYISLDDKYNAPKNLHS